MKKQLFRAVLILVLAPIGVQAQITVIKAGKLVDPVTGTTAVNQVILIEGTRIKAVGPDLLIPINSTIIDLSRATVLPGLFDCHTHLCLNVPKPRAEGFQYTLESLLTTTLTNTTAYRALQGAAHAREMLDSGFTTVRDMGNAGNYADSDLRRAVEDGLVVGPTIINSGRIIAPFGGQFPGVLRPDHRNLGNPEYLYADTRDELKKAIRENILYGGKLIKIVVDDQPYIYSVDDIRFIVEEAAKAGLKVAAHCSTAAGARNAAEAGVSSIEHGWEMTDETIEWARKNDVMFVGTDFTEEVGESLGVPGLHPFVVRRLKRVFQAGIPMAFGTDAFGSVPGRTRGQVAIGYIDSFVDAGVPARVILQVMIPNAVRLLGVENERGAIRSGMAADIIAVPENPLENINALKQVLFVMKEGKVIRHSRS